MTELEIIQAALVFAGTAYLALLITRRVFALPILFGHSHEDWSDREEIIAASALCVMWLVMINALALGLDIFAALLKM